MSWESVAPSQIEGVENPTLTLRKGENYTITWTEDEQGAHNLAVYGDGESAGVGPTEVSSANDPA
ncbi:hypothetical protein C488_19307 [Natrinema pellirubrum DSM 15624]|uniref:Uncharacterized protein n=1 Tax=Natrinema pellirubrum (strain DSM 15624 / CIP 106293 / JCM 10476 / NCIMB 786 / 157) TaxID=797303 RepID=L9YBA2_NATP1|nr:hypothetical protein [Natrinema pellirubrum]ELY70193.1 hypothetical protein C488_19307 [Natrinema pellirubrum DSM 15624]